MIDRSKHANSTPVSILRLTVRFILRVTHYVAFRVWLSLFALLACTAHASENHPTHIYTANRIVAVGDVHGAYEALQRLLRANKIIDSDNRWIAGTTHLVSLGDMLDRGSRSREVMDLFRALQAQASSAGGQVHVLLGNHESMNLLGDLRDVSDAEFASYLTPPDNQPDTHPNGGDTENAKPPGFDEHRAAFALNGDYGSWLLSLPVMIKINDTLFVHGGIPPLKEQTLEALNQQATKQIEAGVRARQPVPENASLLGADGPLWYRGSAACHPLLETPILDAQLSALGAKNVVIGHTPTPTRRVQTRLQGRVTIIDTGMLQSVYRGAAYLLEITAKGSRALDVTGNASAIAWWHPVLTQPPAEEADLAERILNNSVDFTGLSPDSEWNKAGKATIAKLIASWRLDRELGLWMTPLTVADKKGTRYLQVTKDQWITEGERRATGRTSSNYCLQGHQNLLVAAFDALQGVTTRSVDSLYVHKANGTLRLAPISRSFGTSTQMPQYGNTPTIPDAMARKLATLDEKRLNDLLGDLLSKRQLKALLARRDKILQWPRTEHAL